MILKKIIIICGLLTLVCGLTGCDAFVRKFTRKPKRDSLPQQEMVLVPEEYKNPLSKEELYRQFYNFWYSWQNELSESLLQAKSLKKKIDCADQSIKNLLEMRKLLNQDKQTKLDVYIIKLRRLREMIAGDIYGNDNSNNYHASERLRIEIMKAFVYAKMKDNLV